MRRNEIEHLFTIPASHPYVSVVELDPDDAERLMSTIDGRRELKLLGKLDQQPDTWFYYVGCASKRVQRRFDEWADNVL